MSTAAIFATHSIYRPQQRYFAPQTNSGLLSHATSFVTEPGPPVGPYHCPRCVEFSGPSSHVVRFPTVTATDLEEGILDPFPLLRDEDISPSERRRGLAKLVNPLLLVTERRGTSSSLHYGAFPLDAFNTDGTLSPPGAGDQHMNVRGMRNSYGAAEAWATSK